MFINREWLEMAKKDDKKGSKGKGFKTRGGEYLRLQRRKRFALITILLVLIAVTAIYIFYTYTQESSSDEISEPKLSTDATIKFSNPNETIDYSFTIENPGEKSDWYLLQLLGLPYDWMISLDELISVGSKEVRTIDFNITSSINTLNTSFDFILNITSENLQKTYSFDYSATIIRTYDLRMEFDSPKIYVPPGWNKTIYLSVENRGNNINEISLSFDENQLPIDTTLNLSEDHFTLDAFQWKTIICNITTNLSTPMDIYSIQITATSDLNPEKQSTITLEIYLERTYELELKCLNNSHRADPGRSVYYTLIVKNLGNSLDSVTLSYHKGHLPTNWTLTFDNVSFDLLSYETKAVICNITTDPASVYTGGRFDILINASLTERPNTKSSVWLNTSIEGNLPDKEIVLQDKVKVDYTGCLEDGRIFDTSHFYIAADEFAYPKSDTFQKRPQMSLYVPLNVYVNASDDNSTDEYGAMIEGFWRGIIGMKQWETKVLRLPPELAYIHSTGHPLQYETLIFEITVVEISE